MLTLTATIAVLLALVVMLLAVPVAFVIDARRVDRLEAGWRVRWLFGLVDVKVTQSGSRQPSPARTGAGAARTSAGTRKGSARMGLAVLRTRGLIRRVRRLAASLFRQVRVEQFRLQMAFGFDDPADTGLVYGCVSPLLLLARRYGLNVECRPMFPDAGLHGVLNATICVRPLSVIGALLALSCRPR